MAALGSEVAGSWILPSSGVFSFLVVLVLLSVFLAALCSECSRRSFELRDSEADKDPSSLIRVVKLEDTMVARENPTIGQIQDDEREFNPSGGHTASFTPWRSHLGAPQNHQDVQTNSSSAVMKTSSDGKSKPDEESSVTFTPWRSHLGAPQDHSPDPIYHTIGGGHVSSPPTNQEPGAESGNLNDVGNSVYSQVKNARQATPPERPLEEEQQEEEEESSPPLPDRKS